MKNEHSRFGLTAEHRGISLRLIGDWQDLAGYYEGDDGNAWSVSAGTGRFVNCGEIETFRANFAARFRGRLFA